MPQPEPSQPELAPSDIIGTPSVSPKHHTEIPEPQNASADTVDPLQGTPTPNFELLKSQSGEETGGGAESQGDIRHEHHQVPPPPTKAPPLPGSSATPVADIRGPKSAGGQAAISPEVPAFEVEYRLMRTSSRTTVHSTGAQSARSFLSELGRPFKNKTKTKGTPDLSKARDNSNDKGPKGNRPATPQTPLEGGPPSSDQGSKPEGFLSSLNPFSSKKSKSRKWEDFLAVRGNLCLVDVTLRADDRPPPLIVPDKFGLHSGEHQRQVPLAHVPASSSYILVRCQAELSRSILPMSIRRMVPSRSKSLTG